MRAKDVALESLRAIKAEIFLAQTASGSKEEISAADEIKLLQKLVKTRKDSAKIFTEQNRLDLAEPELAQIAVIENSCQPIKRSRSRSCDCKDYC
jgi:uncharacterized protein YqeY